MSVSKNNLKILENVIRYPVSNDYNVILFMINEDV